MAKEKPLYDGLENWREELRENIIVSLTGKEQDKTDALNRIAYAYRCFAPSSIFKYYSPNTKKLATVIDKKMWYSAPAKFNDAFDSASFVDRQLTSHSLARQMPENKGILEGSIAWKEIQSKIVQFENRIDSIRHTTGVSCFSESDDSLLMWAHYAQNHQGFCVEYKLSDFYTSLGFLPIPVIYSRVGFSISSIDLGDVQNEAIKIFISSLTSKSQEWQYEREWRIFRDSNVCGSLWNSEKQGALLPSITPSSITLGCEVESSFEHEIQQYCRMKQISLYKMSKDNRTYSLCKIPIVLFDVCLQSMDTKLDYRALTCNVQYAANELARDIIYIDSPGKPYRFTW